MNVSRMTCLILEVEKVGKIAEGRLVPRDIKVSKDHR